MLQNMGMMGNASNHPRQHKLDTIKKTMINEGIAIIGLTEVEINWSKITITENIYNRNNRWF